MKIRQVRGYNLLSEAARESLETAIFPNAETAARSLQEAFPHHVIVNEPGRFSVFVKDRSFHVAQFEAVRDPQSAPVSTLKVKVRS